MAKGKKHSASDLNQSAASTDAAAIAPPSPEAAAADSSAATAKTLSPAEKKMQEKIQKELAKKKEAEEKAADLAEKKPVLIKDSTLYSSVKCKSNLQLSNIPSAEENHKKSEGISNIVNSSLLPFLFRVGNFNKL